MKTVICYGDSNTHGYNPENGLRFPREIRWPGSLQELLGRDYYVVEEGCNGRTTVFKDQKEPWKCGKSYLRACLNSHKPIDVIVMMLGSNDMKKCYHASAEEIADGAGELVQIMKKFLRKKQSYVPKIVLISPPELREGISHSPFAHSFSEEAVALSKTLAPLYQKVAKKEGCIFLDAAKIVVSSEEDHLHLRAEEHEKLARAVAEVILR